MRDIPLSRVGACVCVCKYVYSDGWICGASLLEKQDRDTIAAAI